MDICPSDRFAYATVYRAMRLCKDTSLNEIQEFFGPHKCLNISFNEKGELVQISSPFNGRAFGTARGGEKRELILMTSDPKDDLSPGIGNVFVVDGEEFNKSYRKIEE